MPKPVGPVAPHMFGRLVNPILTVGGQIMPTNYHRPPPQSFSPSGITDLCKYLCSQKMPKADVDDFNY